MIQTVYGRGVVLICDCCDREVKYFDKFQDAVDYKKENGWKSVKDDSGTWHDVCPYCHWEE